MPPGREHACVAPKTHGGGNVVVSFQDDEIDPTFGEIGGRRQSDRARADDHHGQARQAVGDGHARRQIEQSHTDLRSYIDERRCPVWTAISALVNIDYHRYMVTMLEVIDITAVGVTCCTPLVKEPIGRLQAEQLALTLKALADPARLRLLSIVASCEGQEACVCDLIEPVGLAQPTVSHHLKVLTEAGFLTRTKRGTWAYYKLRPDALTAVADFLTVKTGRDPSV